MTKTDKKQVHQVVAKPYFCDSLKSVDTVINSSLNVVHVIVCWAANYNRWDTTLLGFHSEDDNWCVSQLIN